MLRAWATERKTHTFEIAVEEEQLRGKILYLQVWVTNFVFRSMNLYFGERVVWWVVCLGSLLRFYVKMCIVKYNF